MWFRIILAGILAVSLGGCTTGAKTQFAPGTDFSALKTYAWETVTLGPEIENADEQYIRKAVNSFLEGKGYSLSTDNPDFLISAAVGREEKLRVNDMGVSLSPAQLKRVQYEQGKLLVTFSNPQTDDMLWMGTARADFEPNLSEEMREARANKAIAKLFDKFPPQ